MTKEINTNLGLRLRTRMTKRLNNAAKTIFGFMTFASAMDSWKNARCEASGNVVPPAFASVRIRPEVVVTAGILQDRYRVNTGDDLAISEIISLLVAEGLDAVESAPEFSAPRS